MAAINSHDVVALTALMAANHVFVDSLGNRVQGARSMEAAGGAISRCARTTGRTDNVLAADGVVLAAGEAGGTIHGEPWRTPAAWKALVRDGKVWEWQVFADNKPVYESWEGVRCRTTKQ